VLAQIAKSSGNLAEAEMHSRDAIQMYERTAGPEHPSTLLARESLAGILGARGNYKPARELLKRTLASLEVFAGPDDPEVAAALRQLAGFEFARKHYGPAFDLYRRVYQTDLRLLGAEDPRIRFDLNDVGSAEFARHHLRAAENLFLRALNDAHGGDMQDGIVKTNLAQVYQAEKRYDEASALYRDALNQFERDGRSEDLRLGSILAGYASLLRITGDYAEAEKLQARATALQVRGVLARNGHISS
jgi:tetratricopeptide (TPR) repeat protein